MATDFENLCKGAFDQIKCTLSIDATYLPKAGGSFSVRGPFDDRAQQVDPDTQQVVSTNVYTLGLKLDDLPNLPVKGDHVRIKNIEYHVVDVQEDGVPGVSVVLFMHRVIP